MILDHFECNTHPRLGPFGTMNGRTIPTTPQMTVKIIIGIAEAPISQNMDFDENIKYFEEHEQTKSHDKSRGINN